MSSLCAKIKNALKNTRHDYGNLDASKLRDASYSLAEVPLDQSDKPVNARDCMLQVEKFRIYVTAPPNTDVYEGKEEKVALLKCPTDYDAVCEYETMVRVPQFVYKYPEQGKLC